STSGTTRIVNNTIYQSVGDALALSGDRLKVVENNIIRVDAGYAINVASSAMTAVQSNNNLFALSADPNARVGLWGSTQATTLAAWRTASSQDAASSAADPLFRDINGADDVLGYATTGSGYDGGRDDNFGLRFGSPAIDAANATLAPATDMFGNARVDDPGTTNVGGSIADIGAIEFISSSLDVTPPRITATVPARVFSQGTWGITTRIDLTFSEAVDAIEALAARNYRLVEAVNGTFGDTDDVVHGLVPTALVTASGGVTQVRLAIATAGGLPNGQFRLTALGGAANGIRDLAGNMLDGNADSSAGGDFVRTFTINRALDINVPTGQTVTDGTIRTGSYQLVKQGGGTLILDKANSHSGGTVVEAGTVVVKDASALGTGEVRIKAGATLVIDAAAGTALAASLSIETGGRVDLGTGSITVTSGLSPEAITGMITAARGDGFWTEPAGLGSSAVAEAIARGVSRTIGWLDNGDGSFTIGFAAPGDSNLDALVDVLDAANFLAGGKYDAATTTSWTEGDYNLDGMLDILDTADFLGTGLFDAGFYGAAPLAAAETVQLVSASDSTADSSTGSTSSPTGTSTSDLAFAALAAQQDEKAAKKRKVFATFP
ncbi:MAG: autotransporter-associated beta strand repeat-containing protein, partial [Planctomycetaceae bacterium]